MSDMKKIKLEPKPLLVTGKPFTVVDVMAETKPLIYQCDHCGKTSDIDSPAFIQEAGLVDILKTLIFGIPRAQCTMKDSINAYDFMQHVQESSNGVLKVTDGIYTWLKDTVNKHGPAVFGVNANAIILALENTDKAQEKAGD